MKKNILLSLIFASIITVSTVIDARKMLPTAVKPTDTKDRFTVEDFEIVDEQGKLTTDKEVIDDVKEFSKYFTETEEDIARFVEFLQSKGFKKRYNDPTKKLVKKDLQKAQTAIKKIDGALQNLREGLWNLQEELGRKKLRFGILEKEKYGHLKELNNLWDLYDLWKNPIRNSLEK